MASETLNHNLLIATEKTPHLAASDGPTDIILDPTGKPLPGSNFDDMKKLRKAGPCANTKNTFINGAVIFIRDGRIDATTKSTHPVAGPGTKSAMFRGDVSAMRGSRDLYKERRQVMRTTDTTRHNCMPPVGPENCYGKIVINALAVNLNAQLRAQIAKLCEITAYSAECSHGRPVPSGQALEVVKSGNGTETLTFAVIRKDTTITPPGNAKCQQVGLHTAWRATYGSRVLKEEKGKDTFTVDVPGITTPALEGIIPGVKWMLDTITGPGILTVTAVSCASSRTSVVRCYPNGKLAVDWAKEIEKIKRVFQPINDAAWAVQYLGRMLNGGSVGKMTFKVLPDGCVGAFECEFKERANHLVGAEWKFSFGCDPLVQLDFAWPVPIPVFFGPFGTVARITQWLIEAAGLAGMFSVGFSFKVVVVGTISRDKDGKYSPGFEASLTFTPNCKLQLVRGGWQDPSHKLTVTLGVSFTVKLTILPNDKGQGVVKGVVTGTIQVGFSVDYEKRGSPGRKLVDYKPEWAKWPKEEGTARKEFIIA